MAKLPAQDIVERLLSPLAISKEHRDQAADTISRLTADNEALRKERDEANADRCFHTDDDPNCKLEASFMRMVDRERGRAEAAEARADALAQEVERLRGLLGYNNGKRE